MTFMFGQRTVVSYNGCVVVAFYSVHGTVTYRHSVTSHRDPSLLMPSQMNSNTSTKLINIVSLNTVLFLWYTGTVLVFR